MITKFISCREQVKKRKKDKIKKEWVRVLAISVFILVMIKIIKNLKWYNLFAGIVVIERGKKPIVKIEHRDLIFMTKKDDEDQLIISEMVKINWKFIGKYGHGYIFEKDGEELFIKKSSFLSVYDVYTIENKEYFYEKTSALI